MDEQAAVLRTLAGQMRGSTDTLEQIGTRLLAWPDPAGARPAAARGRYQPLHPGTDGPAHRKYPGRAAGPGGPEHRPDPGRCRAYADGPGAFRRTRAVKASPATTYVGANGATHLSPDLHRWLPGDDRTRYARPAFPAPAWRDGQQLRIEMTLTGVDPRHRTRTVTVTFRERAAGPAMPAQRHRPRVGCIWARPRGASASIRPRCTPATAAVWPAGSRPGGPARPRAMPVTDRERRAST